MTGRLRGPHALSQEVVDRIDFDKIFAVLHGLPKHVVMCWVKTIANGWATSSRLHSQHIASCIFCHNEGADCLHHYSRCVVFSEIISEACVACRSSDPLVVFALSPCDLLTMKTCFVRFTTYHVCHNKYLNYCPARFADHNFDRINASLQRWRTVLVNSARTAAAKFELLAR